MFCGKYCTSLTEKGADVYVLRHGETNNNAPANEIILGINYKLDHKNRSLEVTCNNETQRAFVDALNNVNRDRIEKGIEPFPLLGDTATFLEKAKSSTHIIFTFGSAAGLFKRNEFEEVWSPYYHERGDKEEYHKLYSEDQLINSMNTILDRIKNIAPKAKIIVTLSPIPLNGLIKDKDNFISPVELDCLSKSLQRVCIHKILQSRKDFDYFPAFEIVKWLAPTISGDSHSWEDPRHPQSKTIALAVDAFVEHYFRT